MTLRTQGVTDALYRFHDVRLRHFFDTRVRFSATFLWQYRKRYMQKKSVLCFVYTSVASCMSMGFLAGACGDPTDGLIEAASVQGEGTGAGSGGSGSSEVDFSEADNIPWPPQTDGGTEQRVAATDDATPVPCSDAGVDVAIGEVVPMPPSDVGPTVDNVMNDGMDGGVIEGVMGGDIGGLPEPAVSEVEDASVDEMDDPSVYVHEGPEIGELRITRILIDPDGKDNGAEWLDIQNVSERGIDISDLWVGDARSSGLVVFDGGVETLPPGVTARLVQRGTGDAPVDTTGVVVVGRYSGKVTWNNTEDVARICWGSCASLEDVDGGGMVSLIDEIRWIRLPAGFKGQPVTVSPEAGRFCVGTEMIEGADDEDVCAFLDRPADAS